MKLIKPSEISARILTMLDESNERVIIVSPYIKISKWYKIRNKIDDLKSRRIPLEIYVRDDQDNSDTYYDLDQLRLQYKKIPHLHSKLYLNERYGIVTSMNLLLSSEINSLEIGYTTENQKEFNDLLRFYHRYIHIGEPVHCDTKAGQPAADLKEIMYGIGEELKKTVKNSWPWFAENTLHISTGRNNYRVSINDSYLRITTCLRIASGTNQKSIQRYSLIANKVRDLTAMKVDIYPGPVTDVLQLSGQAQLSLKSTCINGILETDSAYIKESVRRFIIATNDLLAQDVSGL